MFGPLATFARGDTSVERFESWLYAQPDLEASLGDDLATLLLEADYRDRDVVWNVRQTLKIEIRAGMDCECLLLPDLAVVPMGMDGLDERVFATVERLRDHGGDPWWLYLSRCTACGQHWMVAQEERIYDDYFLKRLTSDEAEPILTSGQWPADFLTYERVLRVAQTISLHCTFLDPLDPTLVATAGELRTVRPDISVGEIAELLGVPADRAAIIVSLVRAGNR